MIFRIWPVFAGVLCHLRWWGVRVGGLCLLVLGVAGAFLWWTTELPTPELLRARGAVGSTRILDRHGQLLYEVPDPLSGRRRPVPLDEIPLELRQATLAVEDNSFYENSGIDLRGIARALWINFRSGTISAGGSTITQQLARNFLLDPQMAQQRTFERKLHESILALKLTLTYPKDEILALYLNQTYYGGLTYGVEAASWHVFGKPVRDLDLAEAALIAGLPQAPSLYNPFANRKAALARQSEVLDAMVRSGMITASQAAAAHAEPLQFASGRTEMRAPHFVHYVLDQLTAQLGPDTVMRGGLTVTTTLDADLQDIAQGILRHHIEQLSIPREGRPNHRVRNGAVVVLSPSDGAIMAMVGSPNFHDSSIQGQFNGALGHRQPGSAIKPLTYAAALERGWTPATTLLDIPSTFATREGRPYRPENYDRSYHGPLTLREALATSSNVVAVRLLDAIGVPALLEIAQRMGITTLTQNSSRFGLALTLGGGEVTPLELTAAYATFANGGHRVRPYSIVAAVDAHGNPLDLRAKSDDTAPSIVGPGEQPAVLSRQIAYLISDILSDRYTRMRAFGQQSVLDIDRPAAVKTGTTSDWRDNWTIGYTTDRVVGVWVGNADGQPMESISGVTGAGPIWHDVMLVAHRGLPPRAFERPDGIVELSICAEGGMLPSETCPATRLERFVAGSQPTQPDTTHVVLPIDPQLGCRAPAGYPAERITTRVFRILPPEAESWAIAAGLPRAPSGLCPLPELENRLGEEQAGEPNMPQPALLNPAPGSVFSLSRGIPPEHQRIEISARAGAEVAKVLIYVDGKLSGTFTRPPYRVFWTLTPGQHHAYVEVEDLHGQMWRSEEVMFIVLRQ